MSKFIILNQRRHYLSSLQKPNQHHCIMNRSRAFNKAIHMSTNIPREITHYLHWLIRNHTIILNIICKKSPGWK